VYPCRPEWPMAAMVAGSCHPVDMRDEETPEALSVQQSYYRAAASEYDLSYGDDGGPLGTADRALDFIGIRGDTLELACGTGQWSRLLEARADSLTCLDGAPETIALARTRVSSKVQFITDDIFTWAPGRRFDSVFFGFWLSHVPWHLWPIFWTSIAHMTGPGGVVGVVDETLEAVANKERWTADPDRVTRQLSDGREFDIVKLRLIPADVVSYLAELGWTATVDLFYPGMFALRARLGTTDQVPNEQ
jgi:SAM-dependent methyltransferase